MSNTTGLMTLPAELFLQIIASVPFEQDVLLNLSLVNHRLHALVTTSKQQLLVDIVNAQFPLAKLFVPTFKFTVGHLTAQKRQSQKIDRLVDVLDAKIPWLFDDIKEPLLDREDWKDLVVLGLYCFESLSKQMYTRVHRNMGVKLNQIAGNIELCAVLRFTTAKLANFLMFDLRNGSGMLRVLEKDRYGHRLTLKLPELILTLEFLLIEHGTNVLLDLILDRAPVQQPTHIRRWFSIPPSSESGRYIFPTAKHSCDRNRINNIMYDALVPNSTHKFDGPKFLWKHAQSIYGLAIYITPHLALIWHFCQVDLNVRGEMDLTAVRIWRDSRIREHSGCYLSETEIISRIRRREHDNRPSKFYSFCSADLFGILLEYVSSTGKHGWIKERSFASRSRELARAIQFTSGTDSIRSHGK